MTENWKLASPTRMTTMSWKDPILRRRSKRYVTLISVAATVSVFATSVALLSVVSCPSLCCSTKPAADCCVHLSNSSLLCLRRTYVTKSLQNRQFCSLQRLCHVCCILSFVGILLHRPCSHLCRSTAPTADCCVQQFIVASTDIPVMKS